METVIIITLFGLLTMYLIYEVSKYIKRTHPIVIEEKQEKYEVQDRDFVINLGERGLIWRIIDRVNFRIYEATIMALLLLEGFFELGLEQLLITIGVVLIIGVILDLIAAKGCNVKYQLIGNPQQLIFVSISERNIFLSDIKAIRYNSVLGRITIVGRENSFYFAKSFIGDKIHDLLHFLDKEIGLENIDIQENFQLQFLNKEGE